MGRMRPESHRLSGHQGGGAAFRYCSGARSLAWKEAPTDGGQRPPLQGDDLHDRTSRPRAVTGR